MFFKFSLACSLKILFNLLRTTAFLETFFDTIKPNLVSARLFEFNLIETKSRETNFPALKTLRKSFSFFILFLKGSINYTVIFSRPFLLLLAITFLPPGVSDLFKKPCVLLLFLFFGWYVTDIFFLNLFALRFYLFLSKKSTYS